MVEQRRSQIFIKGFSVATPNVGIALATQRLRIYSSKMQSAIIHACHTESANYGAG